MRTTATIVAAGVMISSALGAQSKPAEPGDLTFDVADGELRTSHRNAAHPDSRILSTFASSAIRPQR
jgi:hypothetical protein